MPDNLDLMLDGPVEQFDWIPQAFSDLLCVYRASDSEPATDIFIYHSDGDGGCAVYEFNPLCFGYEVPESGDGDMRTYQDNTVTRSTLVESPRSPDLQQKLREMAKEGRYDIFFSHIEKPIDEETIVHFNTFAALYHIYRFFSSNVGVEQERKRTVTTPKGTTPIPIGPYKIGSKEGGKLIPFPPRLRVVEDDSTSDD